MKALIVSDAQTEGIAIRSALEEAGYDTICYRWLLKALDNVEEIQPHLVVINAVDYPRHWKVLVQHMKCSLKTIPQVVLLTPPDFDDEEAEKAQLLEVRGCISGTNKKNLERLQQLVQGGGTFSPTPAQKAKILFIHPQEGILYSGQLTERQDDYYNLVPDRPIHLNSGDLITDGSLKTAGGIKSIRAQVMETQPELVLAMN